MTWSSVPPGTARLPRVRSRVVVLVSGSGTTLQALLDAPEVPYSIVAVVGDDPAAGAFARAAHHGIPVVAVVPTDYPDRAAWDIALADALASFAPDWIMCAGFMRILGPAVLDAFPHVVVNTHPALLPSFPGAHGVRDALAYGVKVTGCTVHLVDSGVDTGPILAQASVPAHDHDDQESLHERIKEVERELVVSTLSALVRHGCTIDGRKVTIP